MFRNNLDAIYAPENRTLWNILAFQGGLVNVGGFLEVGHFVSHVTGFSGHLMVELFNTNMTEAFFYAIIPFAFLSGAVISGFCTEVRRKKNKAPIYLHIMVALTFLYLALAITGALKLLPVFGSSELSLTSAILLALLCGACGSQNALFTSFSGAVVRTTHLTGLFTDFGINLSKLISRLIDDKEYKALKLQLSLITAFMLGSLIGVWLFSHYQYRGWFFPAVISSFVAFKLYNTRKRLQATHLHNENKTSHP